MPLITTTGGGSVRGFGRGRGEGDIVLPPSLVALGINVFYSLDTQVTLSTPGVYYTILRGSSISFNVYGARGGNGGATPGSGSIVSGQCNLSSIPDGYLVFVVGGRGGQGGESAGTVSFVAGIGYLIPGGFNGGGIGVDNNSIRTRAGGGGGASDIRLSFGASETDYNGGTRILVAGGGGGSTSNAGASGGNGGWPNGSNAATTSSFVPGFGGTQTAGGSLNGGFGLGGSNLTNTGWNGGGGGGWYGGGAPEQHIGAGGGSSYYDPNRILNFTHGTSSTTNGLIEFTFS